MTRSRVEPKYISVFSVLLSVAVLFSASAYPNVLVVINDSSAESVKIGNYYAWKRNIATICHITSAETVTRESFESDILNPVAECIGKNQLQDDILYIVTTEGIPLAVAGESVDSKLALVYRYLITGSMPYGIRIENPYFSPTGAVRAFTHKDYDIYLVTRLTSVDLVDRALAAESGGDFYFDMGSPQKSAELEWVQQAAASLKKSGVNAVVDTTAKVMDGLASVEGYLNPLPVEAPLIRWKPGAMAVLQNKDAAPAAPGYIRSGVTGLGYYLGDPLSDGWFRPQILFPAYTAGFNLAESFYASSRYLNSRNVVIGDPLAAPYAKTPVGRLSGAAVPLDRETGLPELFSQRKLAYLLTKYSTSREAAILIIKGQPEKARELDAYLPKAAPEPEPKEAVAPEIPQPQTVEEATPAVAAESVSLDFPLRLLSRTPIQYPDNARRARVQGVVVVNLLIDEMGQVMKVDLVSGDKRLAKPVLETVKYWRFEPELDNGRPVVARIQVPVTFRITNKP